MNNLNQYPADDNQKELYKKFPSTHYLSNPMNVIHSLAWCTFWRRNMHRFVRDYLKLSLYVYQELAIYLMGISNFICIIASRNDAKSFIIALYACCRCILYPGTKFRIGSATKKQAKLIVSDKILDELCEWSKPLKAEIADWSTSENNIFVKFKNGSKITVFVANDNARGLRSNAICREEFRQIDKKIEDSVISPFQTVRNQPYMLNSYYGENPVLQEDPVDVKDWETNWDLYGTSELDALNKKYTEELEKVQDYAKPWSELTDEEKRANSGNEDSYNIYHNKYVEIYGYISANGTLTAAIAKRNQEKEKAQKILDGYNSQMSSMKISASINNADYGFTDEDKTVIYSLFHDQDYQNNNIVSTSVDTSVTEIDREKELYDDAVEKLSEVAQPQFKFTVSLDNLYRIEAFKHWQGELELLKFIRLGIRDDYSIKLRVTGITWNPCDVTEDLTLEFSNMITSRSGRTDLTELLDTENNRGSKNSISFGTGDSDSEKEYLSSMLQQLVKMGAFKTAVGNIAGSTTANLDEARINTLVSNFINASKIKVDNIEGDKGSFNEFFTKYLDSEVISTNLINGQNGDFIDFVNSHLNMKHITTELLQGETGNTFIDFVHNEMKTGTITADQIRSEDGKTFVDLVNGQIQAAKITTDQISGGDGTTFIDFLKNQISTSDITANQIKGWGDSQTLIDFVNNKITTSNISANKITGLNDSKTFIDFVNNQINTSVINSDLENVKNILAGNAGVGNLQSIHLTSANAVIDEAVIKQIIAAKISVADLMIHEATAELITLISQDGKPSIAFKNSTQQFYDSNGNVRVQIGQDATGAFTFSLFDETGTGVLIDSKTGVHDGARFVNGLMGTLTGNVIGNVSGSASYATSSDTANYINLVATNEIRFYKNQFKGGTVHFGYRWSDGSTSPLITEYRFNNGNGSPTQVTASQFNGNLNGIATRTTLLNPVTTSDTFTTGTSTWRNGITDGYVVWGQWWKDTSLTNDTGDLTIWIRKEGAVTTANMTIDGTIYAVGGFNGNATSATKLQTARKIGNASFDGTADISLSSIGAASSGHTHNYASTLSLNGTDFTVTSNKITVSREQLLTAIGEVTKTANGYMSAADKAKLDNINIYLLSMTSYIHNIIHNKHLCKLLKLVYL